MLHAAGFGALRVYRHKSTIHYEVEPSRLAPTD